MRVIVSTLDDASKLLKVLEEQGYSQVSMGQPGAAPPTQTMALLDRAKSSLNKLNGWIVAAMLTCGAHDKEHAVTADKIVGALQEIPGTETLFSSRGEGVVSRTVSMVASSVLADKMAWVAYEKAQPRRFWLTEEGVRKAKMLAGGES